MTLTQAEAHRLFEYRDGVLFWKVRPKQSRKAKGDMTAGTKTTNGYLSNSKFFFSTSKSFKKFSADDTNDAFAIPIISAVAYTELYAPSTLWY